jgi:hypothetical protein
VAAVSLVPADLAPFATIDEAKALAMIEDVLALAARVAPCITEDDFAHEAAAKAVLRGAILRWHDAGSGAVQTEAVDDYRYTQDNRQTRKGMFWPSEISELQNLCRTGNEDSGAFSVDTLGCWPLAGHAEICALRFGAYFCSCGADLTCGAYPLYELP